MKDVMLRKMKYFLILYFLLISTAAAWAQANTVKGKVTDQTGAGLPGVTVL